MATAICIFFVAIAIASCQKEFSNQAGGGGIIIQPPAILPDSNYLYRVIEIDTTSGTNDTVLVVKLSYDVNKRVTKIDDSIYKTTYQFYYTAQDSLPYKTTRGDINPGGTTGDKFHFYNSTGRLIKDSSERPSDTGTVMYNTRSYTTTIYSYNAGLIAMNTKAFYYNATSQQRTTSFIIDTCKTDAAGNIIAYNSYSPTLKYASALSYVTTRNPVNKLNIFNSLSPKDFSYNAQPDWYLVPHTNNINSWTSTEFQPLSGNWVDEYYSENYLYNAGAYPISCYTKIYNTKLPAIPRHLETIVKRYYYYRSL